MSKKSVTASKSSKHKKGHPITYLSQQHVSKFVKKMSAFTKWCEREEFKITGRLDEQEFDKSYKLFEQEREKQKSALWNLQHQAQEEKRKRVLIRPGFESLYGRRSDWIAEPSARVLELEATFYTKDELPPTKTYIYSGAPASTSYLIYPCPDLRQWSAWFEDEEVTLNQGYRHWFPESNTPPLSFLPGFVFSGLFIIDTRFTLQGVVSIGRYGSVTVDIATYISVVQCNAPDKNHDGGWHYDQSYDQIITTWTSYCNCDSNQQRFFSDTQQGLHTFAHYIDLPVHVICTCGAPNRFVEVTHILTVTAVNATCQFGPNRQDCLAGSSSGWINTYWPVIKLQYVA